MDRDHLYRITRTHGVSRYPRIVIMYIVIAVYCAPVFRAGLAEDVFRYGRRTRWGVRLVPVLFETESGSVVAAEAVQNNTLFFWSLIEEERSAAVARARGLSGH